MGQVVAAALGVSQRPGRSLVASIADYLAVQGAAVGAGQLRASPRPGGDARGAGVAGVSGGADPGDEPRGPRGRGRARVAAAVAAASRPTRRGRPRRRRCGACCSSNGPKRHGRRSPWMRRTRRRSPRSAAAWTGSRLAIELAAARVVSMSPLGDPRAARRTVPAPHRRATLGGGTPSDVAGDGRLVVLAARRSANGRCSTGSACSPAASTPRRRRRS